MSLFLLKNFNKYLSFKEHPKSRVIFHSQLHWKQIYCYPQILTNEIWHSDYDLMGSDAVFVWWILFQRHLLPLKHRNPSDHKVSHAKRLKLWYQNTMTICMQVHFSIQNWNSSIMGSRLNFNPSNNEWLSVNRPCFFYSTNGIQLVPPALWELRLWKPIFTCQSNYMLIVKMIYITAHIFMEWHMKLFILWNLYSHEDFKLLMQCGTAITCEVEVWCPPE